MTFCPNAQGCRLAAGSGGRGASVDRWRRMKRTVDSRRRPSERVAGTLPPAGAGSNPWGVGGPDRFGVFSAH